MRFDTTARDGIASQTEKQDMPACLPLVSFAGDERAAAMANDFDWNDADAQEHCLVNAPKRKIAVFANQAGDISLIVNEGAGDIVTSIDPDEAQKLIALLQDCIQMTAFGFQEREASFAAFEAIQRAAEGGASNA